MKPFPRVETDDESKNRYLAKLTRVQCRLRMQKMVELSGSLVGRRVRDCKEKRADVRESPSGKGKSREDRRKERGRRSERKAQFKCSLE